MCLHAVSLPLNKVYVTVAPTLHTVSQCGHDTNSGTNGVRNNPSLTVLVFDMLLRTFWLPIKTPNQWGKQWSGFMLPSFVITLETIRKFLKRYQNSCQVLHSTAAVK